MFPLLCTKNNYSDVLQLQPWSAWTDWAKVPISVLYDYEADEDAIDHFFLKQKADLQHFYHSSSKNVLICSSGYSQIEVKQRDAFSQEYTTRTIATFKRHLDGYMDRKGLEGYGPTTGKWEPA